MCWRGVGEWASLYISLYKGNKPQATDSDVQEMWLYFYMLQSNFYFEPQSAGDETFQSIQRNLCLNQVLLSPATSSLGHHCANQKRSLFRPTQPGNQQRVMARRQLDFGLFLQPGLGSWCNKQPAFLCMMVLGSANWGPYFLIQFFRQIPESLVVVLD